jgi:hypothetical protein
MRHYLHFPQWVFFSCLILLSSAPAHGQVHLDISTGLGFTSTHFNEVKNHPDPLKIETGFYPNFFAGLRLGGDLGKKMEWRTEFQYAPRGMKYETNPGRTPDNYYRYHYICIQPEVARKFSRERLMLRAGLNAGKLLAVDGKGPGYEWTPLQADFIENIWNGYDFGAILGAEWKVFKGIFVRADLYWGLAAISEREITDANGADLGTFKERSRAISLAVGYRLLGK